MLLRLSDHIGVQQTTMSKTYHEVITLPTFEERYEYLKLGGNVGEATFGSHRYLNQLLYKMPEWRKARRDAIVRDGAFDLAHPDHQMGDKQPVYVHHINPITIDDILERSPKVLSLDNLIVCSFETHQAIHYGSKEIPSQLPIVRSKNDTCPWR